MPSCLRLFEQLIRRADSRAVCTAGNSSETSTPIMAMTTSSSTSGNARRNDAARREAKRFIKTLQGKVSMGRERNKAYREPSPGKQRHFKVTSAAKARKYSARLDWGACVLPRKSTAPGNTHSNCG